MKVNLEEFESEYTAWIEHASKNTTKNLTPTEKEFTKFVKKHPKKAVKMLQMYYLTCGPISR
jgi:hypothetical protein